MDANRVPPNSRVYSTARMKRRANKSSIILPDSDAMIKRKQSQKYRDLSEDSQPAVSFRRKSVFDPNAENIRPGAPRQTSSKSITTQKAVTTASLEAHFASKQLEHMFSDSSCGSDSSRPGGYVHSILPDMQEERQKLKVLGSLLPDEVLRDPISTNCRSHQTALMFPDVSGFTQLCQKYDKTGKGGPSRLTAVLNGYIGSMIKIVLARNGDVCKFGGDAFLCTWKVTEDMDLAEIVHLAIESAIDIQKNCGEHKTDVGVKLRVKIAVAAGNAVFSIIGTKTRKHYVIVGPPVLDVRLAEQLCRPGDVIVSPSAWKYVKNYMIYSFTYHSDNRHIKVHDFGPLWKSGPTASKIKSALASGTRHFLKSSFPLRIQDVRPFILPPVMRSIDLGQSLDYLTEMRQVAIVFFNITADFETMDEEDIIHLSNKAFITVSGIVAESGGGTNKLTLFDKDMAILTVFGLKGFKHAIASQVALKCAYKCVEQLKKLKVKSAAAGVTTGMAYCGVIGHAMRKEYTVMGHPVNMAARLMCAYQNIVSCDRSTFLHSKLESGHFEVLHLEYMKGIQNAGPFYKFNIRPKRTKLKLDHETQPLLGRVKEVEQFENFLKFGMRPESTINFFIIYGTARIGKSRLVARLVNVAENEMPSEKKSDFGNREIYLIPLTEDDAKVSYSTIRLLFQPLLGLGDSSSVEEREDKILLKLGNIKEFSYLAAFNQIFNVNFDLTPQYLSLDHKDQVNARMVWLQNLYERCFPKGGKWLIVIDDAEFMDEESWRFLTWCSLESTKALYLLTIGEKKVLSEVATSCLDLIKAKRITLSEIDKWYYLGLACQILGVKAIPMELENMLQNYKSSGNPGWLESFLLSLLQSKSIYISQVTSNKMKSLGLVAPPEFMLTTKVPENKEREDFYWVDCLETFESMTDIQQGNIRVCLLTPDFRIVNEGEGELTMDVMFIKTIDTLEPLAQLVLKAGSVLGNNLVRTALEYLISREGPVEKRQIAKAIKNLFDIKILTCAKGDLTQTNLLVPKRMILGASIRNEVTCECVGLIIPETCLDLPKYASCGYMQFSFPTFRETLYNLLLDDQKKTFHYASIEFLRNNIHRCKSCHNERFNNVLGYEQENEVKLACTITPMHGVRSTKLNPKSNMPSNTGNRKLRLFSFKNSEQYNIALGIRASDNELGALGATDMGDCQCSQILSAVYSVLLEHATGSGRKDLMLEVQLEYASVSLTMYNIPLTMQILEQALGLVNQMKEEKEHPDLYSPYIYSKIYTLMGATKLSMGRLDESLELLRTSLQYMSKTFPKSGFSAKVLTVKQAVALRIATEHSPGNSVGKTSQKKAAFTDLLSECLGLISVVYMYMKNLRFAKYASLWSLNKALESNRNLFGLCTAYANLIEVSYRLKDLKTCSKLEVFAIDVCRKSSFSRIEIFEWEAIGRLYKVIFQTRHVRAEIEEAVHIGFQSIKIASVIHSTYLKLDLIPDLIFALIQMNRLSEAVSLLQELEFISRLDSDKSSRLWYYAISLDFQLYTGFTVVTYDACEEFINSEDSALIRDPYAKYRLYTSMWLWCVRHAEWESIKAYGKVLKNTDIVEDRITPATVFTLLERLEGFLIMLVYKMDSRNIQSINPIFADIHAIMHRLDKDIKILQVFKPRYMLLKSYYRQIRFRDNSYYRLLNQAQVHAEKMKDKNTSQWITHLKMLWGNAISQIQREYWSEHSRVNVVEWHESDQESKKPIISYSLPLPKF